MLLVRTGECASGSAWVEHLLRLSGYYDAHSRRQGALRLLSADHAVAQVRYSWGLEHSHQFELWLAGRKAVE